MYISQSKSLCLRKAELKDIDLLFEWANDDVVRKNSINTEKIEYDGHKEWFIQKLESKECDVYLYYVENIPVGQIRLDYLDNTARISFSIDKLYRGQGHGSVILKLAEFEVSEDIPYIMNMTAVVRTNNIASRKIFEELGYTVTELGYDKSYTCYIKEINI